MFNAFHRNMLIQFIFNTFKKLIEIHLIDIVYIFPVFFDPTLRNLQGFIKLWYTKIFLQQFKDLLIGYKIVK